MPRKADELCPKCGEERAETRKLCERCYKAEYRRTHKRDHFAEKHGKRMAEMLRRLAA